jgi:CHAD domain-containing protein
VEDLFSAVDEAFGVVVSRDAQVDLAFSPSIHRVRVAFKKFRYMMEIVNPLLPRFPEKNMKKMQEYQTHMGNIQDTEVFLRTLDVFNGQRESYDPQPARRFYEQRHAELILAYMQQRGKLASFWRTAPDQPFPWEQSK